jgi:predicted acyltransferase
MPEDSRNRLESLDAFRGATVAAMLLVNNPGSWGAVWPPLRHAEWHGWTMTDLIFPFFLFVVGITTELSKKEPAAILRRGALIILAGLLLNAFPFTPERFERIRVMGVLQRIGIVYIAAAFLARWLSRRLLIALSVAMLLGYWWLLTRRPLAPPEATLAAVVDRALIGERHLWAVSRTWDPEGIVSTLPSIVTALIGILMAGAAVMRRTGPLLLAGLGMAVTGWAWGLVFPVNKNLWTSSYVLLTAGLAASILAVMIAVIDIRRARRWATPFLIFGMNPLLAFLGSGLMARTLGLVRIEGRSLHTAIYRAAYQPFFEPHAASFLFAVSFVAIWLLLLCPLYRKRIVIRA